MTNRNRLLNIFMSFILSFFYISIRAQTIRDTIYFNNGDLNRHMVFIDTPHSKYHDLVFDLLLSNKNRFDSSKIFGNSPDNQGSDYSKQWITLNKYKGNFYAYFPSEPFSNTFLFLGERALVMNDFNEGFVSYRITRKSTGRNKTSYALIDPSGIQHSLSMKKKTKSTSVVRSSLFNVRKLYFVNRSSYPEYPIVVNYCPDQRCPEFPFK